MSTQSPKISIIVPVYKVENYLHRCVDSILAQTFTDFEVLLIDDGSPDRSGEICDEYAQNDLRVRVFHKENGGVSSARNYALNKCCGNWVVFVDGDDWIPRRALEQMMLVSSVNVNNNDLFVFKLECVREKISHENDKIINSFTEISTDDAFGRLLDYRLFSGPVAKLFRKSNIANIRFDERLKIGEDQLFCLEYIYNNKSNIKYIPQVVYYYYQNELSALHLQKSFKKRFDELLNILYEYLCKNRLWNKYHTEYYSLKFKLIIQSALSECRKLSIEEVDELGRCYSKSSGLLNVYLKGYYWSYSIHIELGGTYSKVIPYVQKVENFLVRILRPFFYNLKHLFL